MAKKAARYTVLKIDPRDFAAHVEAATKLGLLWFAKSEDGQCWLYLFFDDQGRENYLTQQYGSVVDEIRTIIETSAPDTPAGDVLKAIAESIEH